MIIFRIYISRSLYPLRNLSERMRVNGLLRTQILLYSGNYEPNMCD